MIVVTLVVVHWRVAAASVTTIKQIVRGRG
jgi:hypothetical protein